MTSIGDQVRPRENSVRRICAIHQPNFFPWLGYFDKIRRSDVFVFLDCVDYPRSGSGGMGSWSNRVKVDLGGEARWLGCPVERFSGAKLIKDVRIASDSKWRQRMLRTLQMNYARAPQFERAMSVIQPLVLNPEEQLAAFNIHAILRLSELLGVSAEFHRQSDISARGKGTELLVSITHSVGADTYLCGGGAQGYQEDKLFEMAGLELLYQNFESVRYGPKERFLPGLSVIDFLMWSPDWKLHSEEVGNLCAPVKT